MKTTSSILLFALLAPTLFAQVPGLLNYQGRVAVSGTNYTGTGQFKFALVAGSGGAVYWSSGANAVALPVSKGLYSVLLGDTSVPNMGSAVPAGVFTNSDVRLRVWFDSGAGLQQLTPDQRIAAAGYALVAASVDGGAIIGSIPDARLSTNVALLAGSPTFTGRVTAVTFAGNGGSLTNLNASQIASGTYATIGGGLCNTNCGNYATIGAAGPTTWCRGCAKATRTTRPSAQPTHRDRLRRRRAQGGDYRLRQLRQLPELDLRRATPIRYRSISRRKALEFKAEE